ncbi:hypothetical protein FA13DRAFT_1725957 [Coprinellus micaceus]|uniref:Uncharacterized protein n=1 Tax=Coprinellus micaceus TaxID=71717 RepID=A0A4Y7TVU0_COPMI|nr:hypothetical protein FA13DRAFT_1725957 [Coprinellus micaceus]
MVVVKTLKLTRDCRSVGDQTLRLVLYSDCFPKTGKCGLSAEFVCAALAGEDA